MTIFSTYVLSPLHILALIGCLTSVACSEKNDVSSTEGKATLPFEDAKPEQTVPPLDRAIPAPPCSGHQLILELEPEQISNLQPQECPGNGGQRLYPTGPLARYCIYTTPQVPRAAWPAHLLQESVIGDCPAYPQWGDPPNATGRGRITDGVVLDEDRMVFDRVVGRVSGLTDANGAVTIAVIDTMGAAQSDVQAVEPLSEHGPLVAAIVSDLAVGCIVGQQSCEKRIVRPYAGLPRSINDSNQEVVDISAKGGRYGRTSDVARAVYQALVDWSPASQKEHLIINLSLGWEHLWGQNIPDNDPAFEVLHLAACSGAIILAAGGNRSPNACGRADVLAPAAWEMFHVTPNSCAAYKAELVKYGGLLKMDDLYENGQLKYLTFVPEGQSMVWGVSAVYDSGEFLINSRKPTSVAAYGFGATHGEHDPMTGTSVATAVVSGIAAAVWSQNHDLSAVGVMNKLAGAEGSTRVISACKSVRGTSSCSPTENARRELSADSPSAECVWPWSADAVLRGSTSATSSTALAQPQPNDIPCPSCVFEYKAAGPSSVKVELSTEFSAYRLESMKVTWWTNNGSNGSSSLRGTREPTKYELEPERAPDAEPTKAWIDIQFTDDRSGATFWAGNEIPVK